MLGLDMLDVAIGVVVIYLLLSLIASAIAEMLESALKYRAKDLKRGIRELLQESGEGGLVDTFYKHPLISALYPGGYDPLKPRKLPSYIPSRTFALAFLDILENPEAAKAKADTFVTQTAGERLAAVTGHITTAATAEIEAKRKQVEEWFNGSMDRVSGWYKRRTHSFTIVIGLLTAIALNVDSIFIIKHLNSDSAVREALVNAASELAKQDPSQRTGTPQQRIDSNVEKLGSFGLPIGWDRLPDEEPVGGWPLRILGWIMTAFAVSFGAPFWFDTLNKIMVIRSTVKPREKSREEGSEDRR